MKTGFVGALALSFAIAQGALAPAFAEPAAPAFRTAAPQQFTAQELERYGMTSEAAARAMALQEQGYQIKVLTPEEADAYRAGFTDHEWLMLGIIAGVVVIAAVVAK